MFLLLVAAFEVFEVFPASHAIFTTRFSCAIYLILLANHSAIQKHGDHGVYNFENLFLTISDGFCLAPNAVSLDPHVFPLVHQGQFITCSSTPTDFCWHDAWQIQYWQPCLFCLTSGQAPCQHPHVCFTVVRPCKKKPVCWNWTATISVPVSLLCHIDLWQGLCRVYNARCTSMYQ